MSREPIPQKEHEPYCDTLISECHIIYCTNIFYTFLFQLTLALSNMTTNESINHKRYKHWQDKDGKFHNPFDRGLRINVLEFLLVIPTPQEYLETDDVNETL